MPSGGYVQFNPSRRRHPNPGRRLHLFANRMFGEAHFKSFALDAIDVEQPVTSVPVAEIARAFLEHLAAASAETFAALGDGEDVRLHGTDVVAGALVAGPYAAMQPKPAIGGRRPLAPFFSQHPSPEVSGAGQGSATPSTSSLKKIPLWYLNGLFEALHE
jgi:hypothetical protein